MSFESLKKQSKLGSLTSKLVKEVEKMNTSNSSEDDRFWKPEMDKGGTGSAIIRFLPAPEGEELPWAKVFSHGFQGPGGWYIENSLTTLGQKDPVTEYNRTLWNSGNEKDKEIVRDYIEGKRISKELYPQAVNDLKRIVENLTINFLYQKEQKGEMDALSFAEDMLEENDFAMIYPDGLFFPTGRALKQLCDVFQKYQENTIVLVEVNQHNASVFSNAGRVNLELFDTDVYKIREFLPK